MAVTPVQIPSRQNKLGMLLYVTNSVALLSLLLFVSIDTEPDIATLNCMKYTDMQGETQRGFISEQIAARWTDVGISLHFTSANLNNIESTCRGDVERCCKKMLTLWLEGHVQDVSQAPVTWKTLLEALKDARFGQLANMQPDRLANQSQCSDATTTTSSSIHSTKYRYNVVMIMCYAFIWSGQSN